jgi:hypothetical protein
VDPARLVDELIGVARKLGIEVRVEHMRLPTHSSGGLCRLKGRQVLLLDSKSSVIDRAGALAEALAGFDFDAMELSDDTRTVLESARSRRMRLASGAVTPSTPPPTVHTLLRAKPTLRRCRPARRS